MWSLCMHGSLFALLYLGVNISRCNQKQEWYTGKTRMYDETHQIQNALITNCGLYAITVPCSLYCIWVSISADM